MPRPGATRDSLKDHDVLGRNFTHRRPHGRPSRRRGSARGGPSPMDVGEGLQGHPHQSSGFSHEAKSSVCAMGVSAERCGESLAEHRLAGAAGAVDGNQPDLSESGFRPPDPVCEIGESARTARLPFRHWASTYGDANFTTMRPTAPIRGTSGLRCIDEAAEEPVDYVAENAAARDRILSLVRDLTDDEFLKPVGKDWTIGSTLAHLRSGIVSTSGGCVAPLPTGSPRHRHCPTVSRT